MALTLALPKSLRHRVVARGFERLGPWVTQFTVDGVEYGGETPFDEDLRIQQFHAAFPAARRILELGCLEGGQTIELARTPGVHITAVEGRHANLERARYARRLLRAKGITFVEADLEQRPPSSFGQFDVVFCVGLLYHLPRPWQLVDDLRAAAPGVFLWTHYATEDQATDEVDGSPGCFYQERGLQDPLSGLSARSFWPTLEALLERLGTHGFSRVDVILDEPDNPHGPTITLAALD